MYRFAGFDGLRGWLSWAVVVFHITLFTGLQERFKWLKFLGSWSEDAVLIFVILSGFVITHLVLEKREPYRFYLARRTLRIYPIYFVTLVAGVFTSFLNFHVWLGADGLASSATQHVFTHPAITGVESDLAHLGGYGFFEYLFLHLTLLHGVVPSNILQNSEFMFLSPAWSLSLEWQFYLVAPIVVWAASRKWHSIILAIAAITLFSLYKHGYFGYFWLPSFLPGATMYFAVGVSSRLLVGRPKTGGSWVALAMVGIYYFRAAAIWPLLIWCVFFATSLYVEGNRGSTVGRLFHTLFDSRLAQHLGKPSYSTYLIHVPIMQIAQYLAVCIFAMGVVWAHLFTVIFVLGFTYVLSQVAYRWIEMPGVALGKRFAPAVARLTPPAASA